MNIITFFRKANLKRNAPAVESMTVETTGLTQEEHAELSKLYRLDPWRDPDDRVIMSFADRFDERGAERSLARALGVIKKLDAMGIPFVTEVRAYYE